MTTNGNVSSTWDEARQLGQLFMMGFDGTTVNDQIRTLVQDYYVGSILLTAKNLESAAQTTQLVLDLQTLAQDAKHPAPLFIAIDQENGGVNSLYDETNIRQFPSAMAIAATNDHKLARQVAKATALELKSCGINWILGPVLDVLTNPRAQPLGVRSFGDDITKVSSFGADYIRGYQDGGIATCGKHFPSYGNLEFFGSPTDVPTITETIEQMSRTAFVPFKNAFKTGIDAVIVGGVAMSSTNLNVMHACLSEQICRDLLRYQMKFEGVVISECLEMEALSRNIGISGGTVMAFQAGCDLLLTCRSMSVQEDAINGLRAGLDSGMIDRGRVDESYTRIMALKAKHLSWDTALKPPGSSYLNSLKTEHERLSANAYSASIIAVRDNTQALPLTSVLSADDELLLLTPLVKPLPASAAFRQYAEDAREQSISPRPNYASDTSVMLGEKVFRDLGRGLARRLQGKVSHASYTANGVRPQHENLIDRAKAVVVVTADAARNKYQSAFAKHISMLCRLNGMLAGPVRTKACVVVAVSSPFDFTSDTSIDTYVCTYDFTETALQALVQRLCEGVKIAPAPSEAAIQLRRPSQARQQWLVEAFRKDRDMDALGVLVQAARNHSKYAKRSLLHVRASTFFLNSSSTEETHFVVRNSSTKELLGFCATYYYPAETIGCIGCILVDPARRTQSIGHSLHDRAVRALIKKGASTKLRLGTRMPNVYPGIPKTDSSEHKKLRRWFANLGWNFGQARPISRMAISHLQDWSPPEGLGQRLTLSGIKFDLVHGEDYSESVLEHVGSLATSEVQLMYRVALSNTEGCAIIRAKSESDGSIVGTLLLYRAQSVLASHIPQLQGPPGSGGIGSPVLSNMDGSQLLLTQGLILLGVRQLKKQGIINVILDYIDDTDLMANLQEMGFEVIDSFEEVVGAATVWTST